MLNTRDEATIVLYHGVTGEQSLGIENFSKKHIPENQFEQHMQYLAKNCNVVSLRKMSEMLSNKSPLPPQTVAVSFDDTFKNNRTTALPVLERFEIPATFFISTGFIDNNRRFWVDLVEHTINTTKKTSLDITLNGSRYTLPVKSNEEKIQTVVTVKGEMKKMIPLDRDKTLQDLKEMLDVDDSGEQVPNYQNMNWDDIRAIDKSPLAEIGGHTVNHEIMSYLDDQSLAYEISESLDCLCKHLEHPIDLYSYPEGQAEHYNDRVIQALKEKNVTICPSALKGTNPPGTDPFNLKRIMVGFMEEPFPFDLI